VASLAGEPGNLTASPNPITSDAQGPDVLSEVLRSIRLSGSLQFCFAPAGQWQTAGEGGLSRLSDQPNPIPFHILVEGPCWLGMGDGRKISLEAGDVVAFPSRASHQLFTNTDGEKFNPTGELPPKPWRELPVLRYGEGGTRTRLLCGYLTCEAMNFSPLRNSLPELIHVRTARTDEASWLRATIAQIVQEADHPRTGGLSMLERLTEMLFIEMLRHQMAEAPASGWLAALRDPALARCLTLIHDDPKQEWTVNNLSSESGVSRSTLMERFETVLGTSPMRYVRDWRLCLASIELTSGKRPIVRVAEDAGYGTEAAFSRAFSRAYGMPPAAWRQHARNLANAAA
jgi:AraC-like DNA-binding protein